MRTTKQLKIFEVCLLLVQKKRIHVSAHARFVGRHFKISISFYVRVCVRITSTLYYSNYFQIFKHKSSLADNHLLLTDKMILQKKNLFFFFWLYTHFKHNRMLITFLSPIFSSFDLYFENYKLQFPSHRNNFSVSLLAVL